jgi:hypothetical protein
MSTAAAPTPALEIVEYARGWGVGLACAQQAIPGAICEVHTEVPPGATNAEKQDLWITATSQIDLGGSIAFVPTGRQHTDPRQRRAANRRLHLQNWLAKPGIAARMHSQSVRSVKTSALHEGKDEFW